MQAALGYNRKIITRLPACEGREGTDHGHLLLLGQLLQLVGLLLGSDEASPHIVRGLRAPTQVAMSGGGGGGVVQEERRKKKKTRAAPAHLVEEVTQRHLVVVEQDFLLGGEEPLAERQAGSRYGRGVVLYVQLVGELVRSELSH